MDNYKISPRTVSLIVIGLFAYQANAATYIVINNNDSGAGSLRQAITDSNAIAGDDIIEFSVTGTITLTTGQLTITDNLTINGPGATNLTVSGNSLSRVFELNAGSAMEINDLTVSGGRVEEVDLGGGGISNNGTLTLTNSIITENFNGSQTNGGGIYNRPGATLILYSSAVTRNSATSGGGIQNGGTMMLYDSAVSSNGPNEGTAGIDNGGTATLYNTLVNDNAGFGDGGISNSGTMTLYDSTLNGNNADSTGAISNSGEMTINNSTISGNFAEFSSGGIFNNGTLTVSNSTIADNITFGSGGGITNRKSLTLNNSTISGNHSLSGGGVSTAGPAGMSNISNTIIAGNASDDTGPDVFGPFNSAGYNLIGKTDDSTGFGSPGDQLGTIATPLDPLLGPLQDNGGPTQTHALLAGSPAVDAGSNALIPSGVITDQRGFLRIVDGTVDIGAYESGDGILAEIDIKPGKTPNRINLSGRQKIPVAILSTDTFLAFNEIDPLSVAFGPDGATEFHRHAHVKDVDHDGDMDLLFHFNTPDTGIACGDTEATLTGELFSGDRITRTDSIVTVNCR